MIKEELLNKIIFFMMIIEWYLDSHITTQRRPGLFEDRVLRMFEPQWENVTREVLG